MSKKRERETERERERERVHIPKHIADAPVRLAGRARVEAVGGGDWLSPCEKPKQAVSFGINSFPIRSEEHTSELQSR